MNPRTPRARQRGFTIIEILVTIVIASVLTATAVQSTVTADAIEKEARARMQVVTTHRRNQVAISNILRMAAIDSLTNFTESGESEQPGFRTVTGLADNEPVLGDPEQLLWTATPTASAPGIENPGDIRLVAADGSERVVARDVPSDSFSVRQEGRNLVLTLTTYFTRNEQNAHTLTSDTVISLRN